MSQKHMEAVFASAAISVTHFQLCLLVQGRHTCTALRLVHIVLMLFRSAGVASAAQQSPRKSFQVVFEMNS
jgi:hypothetical protein